MDPVLNFALKRVLGPMVEAKLLPGTFSLHDVDRWVCRICKDRKLSAFELQYALSQLSDDYSATKLLIDPSFDHAIVVETEGFYKKLSSAIIKPTISWGRRIAIMDSLYKTPNIEAYKFKDKLATYLSTVQLSGTCTEQTPRTFLGSLTGTTPTSPANNTTKPNSKVGAYSVAPSTTTVEDNHFTLSSQNEEEKDEHYDGVIKISALLPTPTKPTKPATAPTTAESQPQQSNSETLLFTDVHLYQLLDCLRCDGQKLSLKCPKFTPFILDDKSPRKIADMIILPTASIQIRQKLRDYILFGMDITLIPKCQLDALDTRLSKVQFNVNSFGEMTGTVSSTDMLALQATIPATSIKAVKSIKRGKFNFCNQHPKNENYHTDDTENGPNYCCYFWVNTSIRVTASTRNVVLRHMRDDASRLATQYRFMMEALGYGALTFGFILSILQIVQQSTVNEESKFALNLATLVSSVVLTTYTGIVKYMMNVREADLTKINASISKVRKMDFSTTGEDDVVNDDDATKYDEEEGGGFSDEFDQV